MLDKKKFLEYMARELLIQYTLWLNDHDRGKLSVLDTVDEFLKTPKANIKDWVTVIANPDTYLKVGAKDNGL